LSGTRRGDGCGPSTVSGKEGKGTLSTIDKRQTREKGKVRDTWERKKGWVLRWGRAELPKGKKKRPPPSSSEERRPGKKCACVFCGQLTEKMAARYQTSFNEKIEEGNRKEGFPMFLIQERTE